MCKEYLQTSETKRGNTTIKMTSGHYTNLSISHLELFFLLYVLLCIPMDGRISASQIWGYTNERNSCGSSERKRKADVIMHCVPLLHRNEGFNPQHMWRFARRFFFLDMLHIIEAWGSWMHYCDVLIFLYLQISCKQIAVFPDLFSNLS